jgi:hypothetical protein
MEQAAEKAGIVWTPNVLRHSFCSYAVAAKGFTWTSPQADHSERMLRDQYREAVTKFEADAYFAIRAWNRPQSNSANTVFVPKNPPVAFDCRSKNYSRNEENVITITIGCGGLERQPSRAFSDDLPRDHLRSKGW